MLPKVILLLDGLDEVSLNQKDKCIKWIHGLAQTDLSQIWITARSHLQTELELEFTCLSYTIKSFSEEDQVSFFIKFWKKELEIEDSEKTRNIAENLISHVSNAISASENLESFIGIPLILYMVAEIYKKNILSIFQTEEKISFHGPVTLIEIYQKFVDLKFDNSISMYLSADARVKPGFKEIFKTLKNKFVNDHELLGARHLFGVEFEEVIESKDFKKIRKLSKNIRSGEDRRGIIYVTIDVRY